MTIENENENKPAPCKRTVKPKVVTTEIVTTVETVTEEEVTVPALTAPPVATQPLINGVTSAPSAEGAEAPVKSVPAPLPIPEDRSEEIPASFVKPSSSKSSGSSKPDSAFLFSKNITNKEYFAAGSAGLIVCLVFVLGFSFGLNFNNHDTEVYEIAPASGYGSVGEDTMFAPEDSGMLYGHAGWTDGYKSGFVDGYQLNNNNYYYGGVAYDTLGNDVEAQTGDVQTGSESDLGVPVLPNAEAQTGDVQTEGSTGNGPVRR